jgi:hypothetical protein
MHTLDSAILAAWARVRPILQSDPDELAARLARRRSQLLLRPPRAWCLAVRAADRRLNPLYPSVALHPARGEIKGAGPSICPLFADLPRREARVENLCYLV